MELSFVFALGFALGRRAGPGRGRAAAAGRAPQRVAVGGRLMPGRGILLHSSKPWKAGNGLSLNAGSACVALGTLPLEWLTHSVLHTLSITQCGACGVTSFNAAYFPLV